MYLLFPQKYIPFPRVYIFLEKKNHYSQTNNISYHSVSTYHFNALLLLIIKHLLWYLLQDYCYLCQFFKITALLTYNSHTVKFILLKPIVQCFLVYLYSWATIITIHFRTFHHLRKYPLSRSSHSIFSQPIQTWTTTNLLFLYID